MSSIKSTVRNRLESNLSETCDQLKSTDYSPRFDSLADKIQLQISHQTFKTIHEYNFLFNF